MTAPEPGEAQLGFFEYLDIPPSGGCKIYILRFFIAGKQLDVVLTPGSNDPHLRMMVALEYMLTKR